MPGQQYRITLTVEEDYLTDPNTVYPVTIDPTLTVSDNTHGAGAIEDAPIYEGYLFHADPLMIGKRMGIQVKCSRCLGMSQNCGEDFDICHIVSSDESAFGCIIVCLHL